VITTTAILLAAGNGSRFGEAKQFKLLRGKPLYRYGLETLAAHPNIQQVVLVVPTVENFTPPPCQKPLLLVEGGATRQESVYRALCAQPSDYVLIHDAARPFIPTTIIDALLAGLVMHPCVVPVLPMVDTVVDTHHHPIPRETLLRVQTPQAFHYAALLAAHQKAVNTVTDDASLMTSVHHIMGCETLFKITTPNDWQRAEQMMPHISKIGFGFDVHQFGAGSAVMLGAGNCVMLGGVRIPHHQGLIGHSDADVVLHALTDALLGAIGAGDIGAHFPPSDAKWRGADSSQFVRHAAALCKQQGYNVGNVDITIIGEEPKIHPHRQAIQETIGALVGTTAVNIKATTTEGLGFTGRREGLAAQAAVLLYKSTC
jgi:2-C-methyl-D-erythritol 4-phosphate cytidylyltransferase / 2-C-methyl-D-erythritol 2,4-cyclodiphosphate synthase